MTPHAPQHRLTGAPPRQGTRKARPAAPLTPDQVALLSKYQAKQRGLVESLARGREWERRHPRWTAWSNNLVGLAGVVGFIVFWGSYLRLIRWP